MVGHAPVSFLEAQPALTVLGMPSSKHDARTTRSRRIPVQQHMAVSSLPVPIWLHTVPLQDACSTAQDDAAIPVIRLAEAHSVAKALGEVASL